MSVKKAEIVGIIYFCSQVVMVPVDTADLGLERYHGDSETMTVMVLMDKTIIITIVTIMTAVTMMQ